MRGDPVEPPFGCKPLEARPGDKVRVTIEATVAPEDADRFLDKEGEIKLSALTYSQEQWQAKIEVIEKAPPPPPQVGEKVKDQLSGMTGRLLAVDGKQAWVMFDDGFRNTVDLPELERVP